MIHWPSDLILEPFSRARAVPGNPIISHIFSRLSRTAESCVSEASRETSPAQLAQHAALSPSPTGRRVVGHERRQKAANSKRCRCWNFSNISVCRFVYHVFLKNASNTSNRWFLLPCLIFLDSSCGFQLTRIGWRFRDRIHGNPLRAVTKMGGMGLGYRWL